MLEQDKFNTVIKENQSLIYKVCYSYCHDRESRKDLQQEILVQLWKSFRRFDGRVKISTWLYRIALNTAISFYRRDSKYRIHKISLDTALISLSDSAMEQDKEDNIVLLYHCIEQLNEVDRALMFLYLDDTPYKEVSDILGISESNVATKISRVKRKLKKEFNNHS